MPLWSTRAAWPLAVCWMVEVLASALWLTIAREPSAVCVTVLLLESPLWVTSAELALPVWETSEVESVPD